MRRRTLPQPTIVDEKPPNEEARPQEPFPLSNELQGFQEREQERQTLRILPAPITPLVGREAEIRQIKAMLVSERLVTLTGAGGVGKMRMAMEVAEQAPDHYDAVCFVELADLRDSNLVATTVAGALRVKEQPGQPIEDILQEFLKPYMALLILDNCEHLLASCASLVTALLADCKNLRLLTTSREAVGIAGEKVWRVPSLPFPEAQHLLSDQTDTASLLREYDALQLFVQRAQVSEPTFRFTPQNASLVAQICRRLDGIPLAIELAAARVRMLSLSQIAARLDDRFHLLTNGGRAAPLRHQTLRALIDWSYDLLNPQEQTLFCRLSVFEGGWTLEAAEEVGAGKGVKAREVLNLLTSLVDKSLVIVERKKEEQNTRYRLPETVRQYAQERLDASKTVRRKHRDFFLKLAEDARPRLQGAEQAHWLAVLDEEHANFRQALKFSLEEPEAGESSLRLVFPRICVR